MTIEEQVKLLKKGVEEIVSGRAISGEIEEISQNRTNL